MAGKFWRELAGAVFVAFVVTFSTLPDRASAADVSEVNSGRPDLNVFLLNGVIRGGETLALEEFIGKMPPNKPAAIILNSPGGNLAEGLKLGRLFYRARIATFVLGNGGECHSACSLAFLGGRDRNGKPSRTKMRGSDLGFHQFAIVRNAPNTKKYTKADMENELFRTRATALSIIEYLTDIREDMLFLHLMLKAPSSQINLISNEDAVTYGIHVMDERTEHVIDSTGVRVRIEAR